MNTHQIACPPLAIRLGNCSKSAECLRPSSQSEPAGRRKLSTKSSKGKTAITPETAIQFERVLGVPVSFWIARENNYREALARAKEVVQLRAQTHWVDGGALLCYGEAGVDYRMS